MYARENLPEGYAEIMSVDLQKDKRLALWVNLAGVVIMVAMGAVMCFFKPLTLLADVSEDFFLSFLLRFGVLMLGMFLYILLHEAVHGVFMKTFGAKELRFGFTGLYAYAGAPATYFAKGAYLVIALAPVVLWGIVLGVLNPLVPDGWFWVVYLIQIFNVSGAVGDFYVTLRFLRLPRDILVRDTGVSMTVYGKQEE